MEIKRFEQLNEEAGLGVNVYREAQEDLDELYTKFVDKVNDILADFEEEIPELKKLKREFALKYSDMLYKLQTHADEIESVKFYNK